MPTPLIETKFYIPRSRRPLVSRSRLTERLDRAFEARLTMVSAPAGFGKTTLLGDWIAATAPDRATVAWLSLDEQDNSPPTFWTYVFAALQRVAPALGSDAVERLQTGQPPAVEAALGALINELSGSANDIVLVIDDYHVIRHVEVHEAMTYLVDHLPPCLHLVIASRDDPPLPLARLRARGELVEFRAADLRFRPDETSAYFNDVMDLSLVAADLDVLDARTEGWAAALQLAALSLQGRDDVSAFIESFAGDNRYIVDYLLQEVLQRQPDDVRAFLLQTSILDRLSGPLCDAVTARRDGETTLPSLERANVLLVPLDDRRDWYRYHHLFADVLRARLIAEQPDETPELHRRASRWFEQNGYPTDAVRHAFAAEDFDLAADLVERALPDLLRSRQEATLRRWLEALPGAVLRARPVLSVGYVGVLMHSGEMATVDDRLACAEEAIEAQTDGTTPVFVDEEQYRELPGMIALYRAGHAQVLGNLADTVKYARLALERLPAAHPLRGGAMALLGLALWSNGELDAAHGTYSEGIALVHAGGYIHDSSTMMLADIRIAQGRLREALTSYQRALDAAGEPGKNRPRGIADLHVGISEIYREQGELESALQHLASSRELGETAGLPEMRYRWFTAMAGVRQSLGDPDGAIELLRGAERLYAGGFSPNFRPIPALMARLWLREGRLADAAAWAREQALTADDTPSYLREFEHLTLARLLLARAASQPGGDDLAEALRLLQRLLSAAEDGGRTGCVIEVLALQALGHRLRADTAAALAALERALALAEPEGYARTFLDEGAPMVALLETLSQRTPASYARRLLASVDGARALASRRPPEQETLSDREIEVVRLLASELSGPDIARELVVSLNTLRTHTKSIYAKLGVNSRRAAVRRAGDLQLL